nr:hypothetical protein [Brucella intermedia]
MSDKAERLHNLITKLRNAVPTVDVPNVAVKDNPNVPLWQTFEPIALEIGLSSYAELRDHFISLCNGVLSEVKAVHMRKETVRENWINCLENILEVFDAKNFGRTTNQVFQSHFSARNLEILDSISERLQSAGSVESSPEELESALSTVRDIIELMQNDKAIDKRIASILSHYLQQMEQVYSQINDFGDDVFWRIYKETFATFVQVHEKLTETENADAYRGKIKEMVNTLSSKSLVGISLVSDIATIGVSTFTLLS